MKLLVLSHSCVTSINQQFYAEVEQQTGWKIIIITPSNWHNDYGNNITPQKWPSMQGELLDFSVWNSGNVPLHIYRTTFTRLLEQVQPDVIYVQHEAYGLATFQIYLANSLTLKRPIAFFTWQNIEKRYPFPFHQMERWVLNQTHMMFSGSQSAKAVWHKKGYSGKSIILPGSVDTNIYCPSSIAPNLKAEWSTSDEIVIGYLGRIVEEKGLRTLLHALKKIEPLPWKLVIVGTGDYETQFRRIAIDLGLTERICYLGYVPHDQAPNYLSAFDLLVIPSETRSNWKEQFGRVIIESMACGTPVIGSDSGEIPFLISETQGGLSFPEGNAEEFSKRLEYLIKDKDARQKLAQKGRSSVLQQYSNAVIVQRFVQGIQEIQLSNVSNRSRATVSV
jgi:L-malate glycosyltransferase